MHAQLSSRSPDALIRSIAARQNGIVYRGQLLAVGLTKMQIETRLTDGRLVALHRGVYLVGAVPSQYAYAQAALFACGDGASLSHRSAAGVWGLRSYPATAHPWVTVPPGRHIRRPRIVVRRVQLETRDTRVRGRLRVTSPPRTVFDCAYLFDDDYELEALVADAAFRRLAREDEMRDQLRQNAGRPGCTALGRVLDREGGPQRTRSPGERWFLRLLRANGICGYEVNEVIHGKEVDFLWRDHSFCVELDGWDGHSSRLAFERDRVKWAHLQANGVDVMPISPRQAHRDERGTVDRLLRTLARKGSTTATKGSGPR